MTLVFRVSAQLAFEFPWRRAKGNSKTTTPFFLLSKTSIYSWKSTEIALPESSNLIGKQCTSIVLPSDPEAQPFAQYHSSKITHKIYSPSHIEARGGEFGAFFVESPSLEVQDSSGQPLILAVPKTGRNDPCPCGSGKKYKRCHGRPPDNGLSLKFGSGT